MTAPTIGRIVHYRLNANDAECINRRRQDARESGAFAQNEGYIVHVGNEVAEGQVFPAVVVRGWGGTTINLRVLLDGNDLYWATSRQEGTDTGTWSWPERV